MSSLGTSDCEFLIIQSSACPASPAGDGSTGQPPVHLLLRF